MLEIEIDGKKCLAPQGARIIEVADANNIEIPRFCYHKELSIAANCRMCLVEVEKAPKTLPACATPVTPGMKVFTKSAKAIASQKAVMEFLLINHPLDCPICDQGGECELQDTSMAYGSVTSDYAENKRVIVDENIGSLIQTNLTRCIQCTRCVRFGQEIAGLRELGMTQRGGSSEIRTFVNHALTSEVSGNIIDLCPVGALTSKPFLYKARAWELTQTPSIAPHDACGSHVYLHHQHNRILRVVPQEYESINKMWISDRDRFSYTGLNHADRLSAPMIKQNGVWHATDWETALAFVVQGINQAQQKHGSETFVALSSPSATSEEYYLLSQLIYGLKGKFLTYHLRNTDLNDASILPEPHFGLSFQEIEQQKAILLIGSDIMRELPMLGLRFRKASLTEAVIDSINLLDVQFNFSIQNQIITSAQKIIFELAAIIKLLIDLQENHPLFAFKNHPLIQSAEPTENHHAIARHLKENKDSFIYLGALAYHLPEAATLRLLTAALASLTNSQWGMHTDGANSKGLAKIHPIFSKQPSSLTTILDAHPRAVLLHHIEPELDCAQPAFVKKMLEAADIVIACTSFKSFELMSHANVLLPINAFSETDGSFTNLMGETQSFNAAVHSYENARPAWRLFQVLLQLFNISSNSFKNATEITQEIEMKLSKTSSWPEYGIDDQNLLKGLQEISAPLCKDPTTTEIHLNRLTQWPIYQVDPLVRRAIPLQQSGTATMPAAYINQHTLDYLKCAENEVVLVEQMGQAELILKINNQLPDYVVSIPAGFTKTSNLGESFGTLKIFKKEVVC